MWLPHLLTLARLPLAVAFAWAYGQPVLALALIALAALTDALDGRLARRARARGASGPDVGGWLDPLVDKVFVVVVLAVIWVHQGDWRVLALVGARELLFLPLVALYLVKRTRARELHADPIGKVATVAQFVALGVIVVHPAWSLAVALGAGGLGVAAAVHYFVAGLRRSAMTSAQRAGASSMTQ